MASPLRSIRKGLNRLARVEITVTSRSSSKDFIASIKRHKLSRFGVQGVSNCSMDESIMDRNKEHAPEARITHDCKPELSHAVIDLKM